MGDETGLDFLLSSADWLSSPFAACLGDDISLLLLLFGREWLIGSSSSM